MRKSIVQASPEEREAGVADGCLGSVARTAAVLFGMAVVSCVVKDLLHAHGKGETAEAVVQRLSRTEPAIPRGRENVELLAVFRDEHEHPYLRLRAAQEIQRRGLPSFDSAYFIAACRDDTSLDSATRALAQELFLQLDQALREDPHPSDAVLKMRSALHGDESVQGFVGVYRQQLHR